MHQTQWRMWKLPLTWTRFVIARANLLFFSLTVRPTMLRRRISTSSWPFLQSTSTSGCTSTPAVPDGPPSINYVQKKTYFQLVSIRKFKNASWSAFSYKIAHERNSRTLHVSVLVQDRPWKEFKNASRTPMKGVAVMLDDIRRVHSPPSLALKMEISNFIVEKFSKQQGWKEYPRKENTWFENIGLRTRGLRTRDLRTRGLRTFLVWFSSEFWAYDIIIELTNGMGQYLMRKSINIYYSLFQRALGNSRTRIYNL